MGKQSLEMTGKGLLRGPLEDVSRQRVQEVTIDRQTYRHLAKCPSMGWRGALEGFARRQDGSDSTEESVLLIATLSWSFVF